MDDTSRRRAALIDVEELAARLGEPELIVLDSSMAPPGSTGWSAGPRIPGALRFDHDGEMSDHSSPLPHTLPSAEAFGAALGRLGIHAGSTVVVYDERGLFSSPRARWMLRTAGIDNVRILDGGLPAWVEAGHPTVSPGDDAPAAVAAPPPVRSFAAAVASADEVSRALGADDVVVLDARPAGRFLGEVPEPRPGVRAGHMPGAQNVPATDLTTTRGTMKATAELRTMLGPLLDGREAIASCGSGVTACVIALAAELTGHEGVRIYDGSWSEWGADPARPVTTA